jgi:hypothetical protein
MGGLKKMVEANWERGGMTVGELVDWLLAFDLKQEIELEKIKVLPHRDGNPEIVGEYYQINGFLERVGNVNAGAGS